MGRYGRIGWRWLAPLRAITEDLRAGMDGVGGGPAAVQHSGSLAVPAGVGARDGGDGVMRIRYTVPGTP